MKLQITSYLATYIRNCILLVELNNNSVCLDTRCFLLDIRPRARIGEALNRVQIEEMAGTKITVENKRSDISDLK